ncbi:flagellar M-ring protein FliF, partial [Roseomonas sp. PWR1]|nr:flagellar M-ring protein FliF [Neoroseomonas nitratireducens]
PALAGAAGGAAAIAGGAAGAVNADGTPALPGQAGAAGALAAGGEGGDAMVSISMVEGQMRASSIAKLQELVDRHPDEAMAVVRRWLTPDGA